MTFFLVLLATLFASPAVLFASDVRVEKTVKGWQLLVDNVPYLVRGVCYAPTKVGEDATQGTRRDWMIVDDNHNGKIDSPYDSWVDKNRNNQQDADEPVVGDFQLLKDMGVNTIRIYHSPTTDPRVQALYRDQGEASLEYMHAPNKELLRDLYKTYGIRVAMGNLLGAYGVGSAASWDSGTDYTDPQQLKNMLLSVEDTVKEYKDEPFLLLWILGNENNYRQFTHTNADQQPRAYAEFLDHVAQRIHELDPHHPVALSNGETQGIRAYAKYTPHIDIFGLNSYRSPGFGTLWNEVSQSYNKPVLLTEYGSSRPRVAEGVLDESDQAVQYEKAMCDIEEHTAGGKVPANSIGGFAFEWIDEWWHNGQPLEQNTGGSGWNQEYDGLVSQGDGRSSPYLRQIKKSYLMYRDHWIGNKQCTEH